jgi:hypothetical protein
LSAARALTPRGLARSWEVCPNEGSIHFQTCLYIQRGDPVAHAPTDIEYWQFEINFFLD